MGSTSLWLYHMDGKLPSFPICPFLLRRLAARAVTASRRWLISSSSAFDRERRWLGGASREQKAV